MFAFPISSFLDSLDSSGVEDLINTTPHARSVERVRCEAGKPSRTQAEKRNGRFLSVCGIRSFRLSISSNFGQIAFFLLCYHLLLPST